MLKGLVDQEKEAKVISMLKGLVIQEKEILIMIRASTPQPIGLNKQPQARRAKIVVVRYFSKRNAKCQEPTSRRKAFVVVGLRTPVSKLANLLCAPLAARHFSSTGKPGAHCLLHPSDICPHQRVQVQEASLSVIKTTSYQCATSMYG